MNIKILNRGNGENISELLSELITESLCKEHTVEIEIDSALFDNKKKDKQVKEAMSAYSMINDIYNAGKSKEYQRIVKSKFPDGLDFEKFIAYIYDHKEEIIDACGL